MLMNAATAFAVPITFQFTATGMGHGYGGSPSIPTIPVPAPFADIDWTWQAPISGSFTLETDVLASPTFSNIGGVFTESGLSYRNPVRHWSLDIREQHFEFGGTLPDGPPGLVQNSVNVTDLPLAGELPPSGVDGVTMTLPLGTGVFDDPFDHLRVSFTLSRFEQDLSVITSRDMIENLVFAPNWNMRLGFLDPTLGTGYQLTARLTSLEQVSVPESGSLPLFAAGIGLMMFALRRRAPFGVSREIDGRRRETAGRFSLWRGPR
jgi:hypothetical protein